MVLTNEERIEILELFGGNSARLTAQIFNERHPDRNQPLSHATVVKIYNKFRETGSVKDRARAGRPRNLQIAQEVLDFVRANPRSSIRTMSRATNHGTKTVSNILHRNQFHAYKAQFHQRLYEGDDEPRLFFCNTLRGWLENNPWLGEFILWSDESLFRLNGAFNRQNNR